MTTTQTQRERRRWGEDPQGERTSLLTGLWFLEYGSLITAAGVGMGYLLFASGAWVGSLPRLPLAALGVALLVLGGGGLLGITIGLTWVGRGPRVLRRAARTGGRFALLMACFLLYDAFQVVRWTLGGRVPDSGEEFFLTVRAPLLPVWLGVAVLVLAGLTFVAFARWAEDRNLYRGTLTLLVLTAITGSLITGIMIGRSGVGDVPEEIRETEAYRRMQAQEPRQARGSEALCFAVAVLLAGQFLVGRRAHKKVLTFPLLVKRDKTRKTTQRSVRRPSTRGS